MGSFQAITESSYGNEKSQFNEVLQELLPNIEKTINVLRAICPSEVLGFIDLTLDNKGLHSQTTILQIYAQLHPVIICLKNNLDDSVVAKIGIKADGIVWEESSCLEKGLPNLFFLKIPNNKNLENIVVFIIHGKQYYSATIRVNRVITGRVRFEIFDNETKRIVPARVKLHDNRGNYFFPAEQQILLDTGTLYRPMWFYTNGVFEIDVPLDGSISLNISKGFEYQNETLKICSDNVSNDTFRVLLRRWINMPQMGWYAGEVHLHSNMLPHLNDTSGWEILPEAEGLKLAFIQTWNCHGQIFTDEYPIGEVCHKLRDNSKIFFCEEFRNNVYGHLCLLNIKKIIPPISTGILGGKGQPDYPPNAQICDETHNQGGIVIAHSGFNQVFELEVPKVSNPGSFETPIDLALGKIDLLEVNSLETTAEWYMALNCGFRVPAATGPDFFLSDCRRVYVYTGKKFSTKLWLQNLKKGKSFITNGPMLFLTVDDKKPGSIITINKGKSVKIRCLAKNHRDNIERLEIIFNGKKIKSIKNIGKKESLELSFELPVKESGWIAARCFSVDKNFWAHTNPVYLEVSGEQFAVKKDLQKMLEIVNKLRRWVDTQAKFENERQKAEVLELCDKGIKYYKKRIDDLSTSKKNEENLKTSAPHH
ncbi:MAG: CehA/McbA family metallohydrolase [Candidatus Bathyarchaeia archaeon]